MQQESIIFSIDVQDPCTGTQLIDNPVVYIEAQIGQPVTVDMTFNDSIAMGFGIPTFCGDRVYEFLKTLPSISMEGPIMTLFASLPSEAGNFSVEVSVTLANYPEIPAIQKNIKIVIFCKVQSIQIVKAPADTQYDPIKDEIVKVAFKFEETPACGLVYTLNDKLSFVTIDETN